MVKIWFEVKKFITEPEVLSQYSPVWGNQRLAPEKADAVFQQRALKGLENIPDLYLPECDIMMSFEEIKRQYDTDRKCFF